MVLVPPDVVTVAATGPGPWAGVSRVSVVVEVTARCPVPTVNVAVAKCRPDTMALPVPAVMKWVPERVTEVPPVVAPVAGAAEVSVGAGTL